MGLLNIKFKTFLKFFTNKDDIIIPPVKEQSRLDELNKSLNKINDRYNSILRKLAE